jgi:hypothetical protein
MPNISFALPDMRRTACETLLLRSLIQLFVLLIESERLARGRGGDGGGDATDGEEGAAGFILNLPLDVRPIDGSWPLGDAEREDGCAGDGLAGPSTNLRAGILPGTRPSSVNRAALLPSAVRGASFIGSDGFRSGFAGRVGTGLRLGTGMPVFSDSTDGTAARCFFSSTGDGGASPVLRP